MVNWNYITNTARNVGRKTKRATLTLGGAIAVSGLAAWGWNAANGLNIVTPQRPKAWSGIEDVVDWGAHNFDYYVVGKNGKYLPMEVGIGLGVLAYAKYRKRVDGGPY